MAVREQVEVGIGRIGGGRAADPAGAQVLLLGPVVELVARLVDRVVTAAEAPERLTGGRGERVPHRGHAGGAARARVDLDRSRSRSGPHVDDQLASARIARRDHERHPVPVPANLLDRDRAVLGAALGDRAQVAVPLRGGELIDEDLTDEEGERGVEGRRRRALGAELRARDRRDLLRCRRIARELPQHRPSGPIGEADPERIALDRRRGARRRDRDRVCLCPHLDRRPGRGRGRRCEGDGAASRHRGARSLSRLPAFIAPAG